MARSPNYEFKPIQPFGNEIRLIDTRTRHVVGVALVTDYDSYVLVECRWASSGRATHHSVATQDGLYYCDCEAAARGLRCYHVEIVTWWRTHVRRYCLRIVNEETGERCGALTERGDTLCPAHRHDVQMRELMFILDSAAERQASQRHTAAEY